MGIRQSLHIVYRFLKCANLESFPVLCYNIHRVNIVACPPAAEGGAGIFSALRTAKGSVLGGVLTMLEREVHRWVCYVMAW